MAYSKTKKGFTLIELSIVLVIIGLLIGGVFGGSSLINTAKATNALQVARAIQTGIEVYQANRGALAGDDPTQSDLTTTTQNVLNGNANNMIDSFGEPLIPGQGTYGESVELWMALFASGSYQGPVSKSCDSSSCTKEISGQNVPSTGVASNAGTSITSLGKVDYLYLVFAGDSSSGGQLSKPVVSNTIGKIMDKKLDNIINGTSGLIQGYTVLYGASPTQVEQNWGTGLSVVVYTIRQGN